MLLTHWRMEHPRHEGRVFLVPRFPAGPEGREVEVPAVVNVDSGASFGIPLAYYQILGPREELTPALQRIRKLQRHVAERKIMTECCLVLPESRRGEATAAIAAGTEPIYITYPG